MRSKFGYGKPLYINFIVFSDPANVEQPLGKEPFREPVSSIAVGCQLDPADPFLSVVLLSPVVLIMELSYLTVGHFECNTGIYVFHTWSFCAGRKASTIGLFELLIIINCWIFCAYTQILSRDVEDFCVHAQKFLILILDNKVFQHWIICAYTQILIETWKFLRTCAEIPSYDFG